MNEQTARYLQKNVFDRSIQRLQSMGYPLDPGRAWNNMQRAFLKIAEAESKQNPRAINPDGAFGKYQVRRESADTLAQRLENWIGPNDISDELRRHRNTAKLSEPVQDLLMTLEFFNEPESDRFVPDVLNGNDIALTEYYNRLHHTNVDEPTIKNWNRAIKSDVGEQYYTPVADPNMGSARGGEQMSPAINPRTIDQLARYRLQQGFSPSVTNYATGSYRNPATSFAPTPPTAPSVWNPQPGYMRLGNLSVNSGRPFATTTSGLTPRRWNPTPGYPDMGNQQTASQFGPTPPRNAGGMPRYDTFGFTRYDPLAQEMIMARQGETPFTEGMFTGIPAGNMFDAANLELAELQNLYDYEDAVYDNPYTDTGSISSTPRGLPSSMNPYSSPAADLMDNDALEAAAYNTRMLSPGTAPSPSGGSGFWNWFKQGDNLRGLGTLFQGVSGLGNVVLGYKQYQTQKKNAELARKLAKQNYENQAFLTNLALEERQIANQMGGFRTKRQRQRVKETLG